MSLVFCVFHGQNNGHTGHRGSPRLVSLAGLDQCLVSPSLWSDSPASRIVTQCLQCPKRQDKGHHGTDRWPTESLIFPILSTVYCHLILSTIYCLQSIFYCLLSTMWIEVCTSLLLYSSCRPCRHVCSCLFSVATGWPHAHGPTNVGAMVKILRANENNQVFFFSMITFWTLSTDSVQQSPVNCVLRSSWGNI